MQQELDMQVAAGDVYDYDSQWQDILRASGWTPEQYERELERRWEYLDVLRFVPPPKTLRSN